MLAAGAITALVNWHIALASLSAFIVAESIDWLVYTYLPGSIHKRMLMSNLFGIPVDSFVFVGLAFGLNWPAVIGQSIVKLVSGMLVVPFVTDQTTIREEGSQ
jgi:queuosine precursor transporter